MYILQKLEDLQGRLESTEKDLLVKVQSEIEKAHSDEIEEFETFREVCATITYFLHSRHKQL